MKALRIITARTAIALCTTFLLFVQACNVEEFVSPTIPLTFTVPLLDRSYTLKSMLEKDPGNFVLDDNSLLKYVNDQEITPSRVDDRLTLSSSETASSFTVGTIELNPAINPSSIDLAEWLPLLGDPAIIPPVDNAVVYELLDPITQLNTAIFDSGILRVTFGNENGPFTVGVNRIVVRDVITNEALLSRDVSLALPAGTSGTIDLDLSGGRIVSNLNLEVHMRTPGSLGSIVDIPSNPKTTINFQFIDIQLSEVDGRIPAQNITYDGSVTADDSSFIREADFKQGVMHLTIANTLEIAADIQVVLPMLITPSGLPFERTFIVQPGSQQTIDYTILPGCKLLAPDNAATNKITYSITANSDSTFIPIHISKNDRFDVNISFSDVIFSKFFGKVKPTMLSLTETEIDVDLKQFEENFTYESIAYDEADITLFLQNTAGFPILYEGSVRATNGMQEFGSLGVPPTLLPPGVLTTVILPRQEVTAFLNNFSHSLPNKFFIAGKTTVNPAESYALGTEATIYDTSSIFGTGEIIIPFHVNLSGGVYSDTSKTEFSEDDKKSIRKSKGAELTVEIENGIPMSMQASLVFFDISNNELLTLPLNLSDGKPYFDLPGGTVNAEGRVISPSSYRVTLTITEDEFSKLADAYTVQTRILVESSNGQTVQYYTSDEISFRVYGKITYNLEKE